MIVSFACFYYAKDYIEFIYIAVAIAALVFLTVLILYSSGIIKVSQRFRGIVLTLFLVSVAGTSIVYISSFFTTALTDIFLGNGTIAIMVSIISLIFSVLNLVFEFDFATRLVNDKMHKKYEWTTAYGLFMTVVMIFFKVFELLIKFNGKDD